MNETNLREIFGEERSVGFDQVAISVASHDAIRSWSKGEVKNPELKTYVENTLPVVQNHLSMAEAVKKSISNR